MPADLWRNMLMILYQYKIWLSPQSWEKHVFTNCSSRKWDNRPVNISAFSDVEKPVHSSGKQPILSLILRLHAVIPAASILHPAYGNIPAALLQNTENTYSSNHGSQEFVVLDAFEDVFSNFFHLFNSRYLLSSL